MNSVERSKKIFQRLLVIIFSVLLIFPASNQIFKYFHDIKNVENRALAEMPELQLSYLDPFPAAFEAYYADHFFLRNRINKAWSVFNREFLGKSPTDQILIGGDGWLFSRDEAGTYLGQDLFSDEELNRFRKEITRRSEYLDSMGCKYYFVVAPTKYSVYPEYLPMVYRIGNHLTSTDQVIEVASKIDNVEVIDLREVLLKHKEAGLLYFKSDNHWNELGAYFAYAEMAEQIRKDFPKMPPVYPLDSFNIETKEIEGGNLARMMNAEKEYPQMVPEISFKHEKIHEAPKAGYKSKSGKFGYEWLYEMVYVSNYPEAPSALVIRESFGNALMPVLPANFSKTVFIFDEWKYMLNKPIVNQEKPDVFIQLTLENFLHTIFDNNNP